jgi:YbgC/YbaW family acyl-CoA thioester hydrolase
MCHIYKKQILEQYLDAYGHVNNASYLTLFEEARWDLVTKKGLGYEYVKETGKGFVVLEVHLRFAKELTLREWITIESELISYEGKVGSIEQKIKKSDGHTATTALVKFGLFDLKRRRLIDPDPLWKTAFLTEPSSFPELQKS